MEQSNEIDKLAEALAKAQGVMSNVVADQEASIPTRAGGSYSYKYADLGKVLDVIRKPLSENELSIIQAIGTESNAIIITTQLNHSSGQWVRSQLGLNVSPEATPQNIGSLITYGRRYGLMALIGIASEDDDGKAAEEAKPRPQARPKPAEVKAETKPIIQPEPGIAFERYNRMKEVGLKRWPESPGQAIPAAIGRWLTLNKFGNWVDMTPEKQEEAIKKLEEEAELA